ncbi:MAG: 50S ribosomal protein L32e [Candidatus Heimdallarchaeota archaeon]|nr:50S ribosomal protein L32e [Candidatus Heimdallarchaeota archaeon]MDH5644601.1 50S ribosomal protein L32e [Candidatus Heimdallarchaeota archaeon]
MNESEKNRLLNLRQKINKKRPKFKRENYFRLKRIQTSWRKPKGIDSKMRHKLKGKRKSPGTGYRNPKAVRGLHPSGKEVVRIFNESDLEKIDAEIQIAQIGSSVGSRKRSLIIQKAEDLEIHIINPQIRRIDFEEEGEGELTLIDDDEGDEEFDLLDEEEDA